MLAQLGHALPLMAVAPPPGPDSDASVCFDAETGAEDESHLGRPVTWGALPTVV